jgi:rod shape-determining protein MreD
MKILVFYLLLILLALSVQAVLFTGTKPDLVLIIVFFYSLRYGQMKGMTYGALAGLLTDVSSGLILGPNILSKGFIGYFVPSVKHKFFQWDIIINTLVIVLFSALDILLVYICLEGFAGVSYVNRSIWSSVVQVLYTTIAGIIAYPIMRPENDKMQVNRELRVCRGRFL